MIPNLEARVLEGSEDDVVSIAEMVVSFLFTLIYMLIACHSFRKVSPVPDPMIPRVLRAPYSSGLCLLARL